MMDEITRIRKKAPPLLKPYISRMAVFGSVVRGDTTQESDIDLLITLKPSEQRPRMGLFKFIEIEEHLSKELGQEVDLVTEDSLSPYIRPYIEECMVGMLEIESEFRSKSEAISIYWYLTNRNIRYANT